MLKKILSVIFVCILFIVSVSAETVKNKKPEITSKAFVLYNPDNDEIVDSKNANAKMYPASLTKMLTALVVVDLCDDLKNEKITVSKNAVTSLYGTGSSTAKLKIGEQLTAEQLLYLLIMPSGNDAANALAEHFCGSNLSFAKIMNKKAKELGLNGSNFKNPHGLHEDDHYTTAADLAKIADAYIDNPLLAKIANTVLYILPQTNKQAEREIRSTNYLLQEGMYFYPYANGLKTGNTDLAGRCLAATAEKDKKRYICILLDVPERWERGVCLRTDFFEAKDIFEYAFLTYETVKIASKGQKIATLPVYETFSKTVDLVCVDDVFATLPKGTDIKNLKITFTPDKLLENQFVNSPIEKGIAFGKAEFILNGNILNTIKPMASITVNADKIIVFWHTIDLYVYIFLGFVCFFVLLYVFFIIRKKVVIYQRKKAKEARIKRRQILQEEFEKQKHNYFNLD